MKHFELKLNYSKTFSAEEIWPNGDVPENPTVEDVRKAVIDSKELWKWDLEPTVNDVTVKDISAELERMKKLREKLVNGSWDNLDDE